MTAETILTVALAAVSFLGFWVAIRAPWKHRDTGRCVCERCR